MPMYRERRVTRQWTKSGPPLRDRSQKTAERRRLLARSFGYASALRSSSAVF